VSDDKNPVASGSEGSNPSVSMQPIYCWILPNQYRMLAAHGVDMGRYGILLPCMTGERSEPIRKKRSNRL
jgi:hypothetical protein